MPVIQISTLGLEDEIYRAIDNMVSLEEYKLDETTKEVMKVIEGREVLCNCDVEKSMQRCLE